MARRVDTARLMLLASLVFAGCTAVQPTVATPEMAGIVIAVDLTDSNFERYRLDTGATVTVDRNSTIIAYKTAEAKARDLVIAGRIPQGDWVMELGVGTVGKADIGCFGLTLDALDAGDSVIFQVEPMRTTEPRWRVRLRKTRAFGWQSGGQPRSDGSYLEGTVFCLNGRGEVTGQLPR